MAAAAPTPTVSGALAEVDRWKNDEEARHKAELTEVEQEISNLDAAIANLHQQLEALQTFRTDLLVKAAGLGSREIQRAHTALFGALQQQAGLLAQRERAVVDAVAARRSSLPKQLADEGLASKVEDYQKFRNEIEPSLQNIPESYRAPLIGAHTDLTNTLRAKVESILLAPVEMPEDDVSVQVAWTVDAPGGTPEVLAVVLPVTDEVQTQWDTRGDGLQTWMAARVVQAVYEAAADADWTGAQANAGGFMDLLAVEVMLESAPADFVPAFEQRLSEVLQTAPELVGARVSVVPTRVNVDYVFPPEADEEESEDA